MLKVKYAYSPISPQFSILFWAETTTYFPRKDSTTAKVMGVSFNYGPQKEKNVTIPPCSVALSVVVV